MPRPVKGSLRRALPALDRAKQAALTVTNQTAPHPYLSEPFWMAHAGIPRLACTSSLDAAVLANKMAALHAARHRNA